MTEVKAKISILPLSDTGNSYALPLEFTVTDDRMVILNIDGREVAFHINDIERLLNVAIATVGGSR